MRSRSSQTNRGTSNARTTFSKKVTSDNSKASKNWETKKSPKRMIVSSIATIRVEYVSAKQGLTERGCNKILRWRVSCLQRRMVVLLCYRQILQHFFALPQRNASRASTNRIQKQVKKKHPRPKKGLRLDEREVSYVRSLDGRRWQEE